MLRPSENPFNSKHIDSIPYRFIDGGWDELLSNLSRMGWRGAIVGPHGCGKTTLLHELSIKLDSCGFKPLLISFNSDRRSPDASEWESLSNPIQQKQFLLIDGAEQLPWYLWRRIKWLSKSFSGLVVTCHQPGILPTLYNCRPSVTLCREILGELVRDKPALLNLGIEVERIYEESNGNMRSVFRELYDKLATR